MRLQRLTGLEREKLVTGATPRCSQLIARLRGILADEPWCAQIIKEELQAIQDEYGDERRTEIVEEAVELTIEDLIADEDMVVTVTHAGYIKRTAARGLPEPAPGRQGHHRHGDARKRTSSSSSSSPRPTPTPVLHRPTARSTG